MSCPRELEFLSQVASPAASQAGKDAKPVWAGFREHRNSKYLGGMKSIHERAESTAVWMVCQRAIKTNSMKHAERAGAG
jgi:hypothetical protein